MALRDKSIWVSDYHHNISDRFLVLRQAFNIPAAITILLNVADGLIT